MIQADFVVLSVCTTKAGQSSHKSDYSLQFSESY